MTWIRLRSNSGRWALAEDGHLFVYLNGSERLSDWVRNFQTRRKLRGGAWVNRVDHREALATIRELRVMIESADKVTVAGHSRGAAEAACMAWELGCRAILLAPKRTGCRDFVGELDYIAYRHRGDIVPYMPPWYAGFKCIVFGRFRWLWEAHEPREYDEIAKKWGLK
jgi:hypothetical protein